MTYFGDENWKQKERLKIHETTLKFESLMVKKMLRKLEEGYAGWDWESELPKIKKQLKHHIEKGYDNDNLIDIANICMMIYFLQEKKK